MTRRGPTRRATIEAPIGSPEDLAARFWPKVDRSSLLGCWEWLSYRNSHGYGQMFDGIRVLLAHRVSWILHNGPIPDGLVCRHDCDNRTCVNPAHLRIGTHADNIADKVARNRQAKGEQNGRARLMPAQVLEIRRRGDAGELPGTLATEYGVTRRAVVYILQRVNWRHLEEAA